MHARRKRMTEATTPTLNPMPLYTCDTHAAQRVRQHTRRKNTQERNARFHDQVRDCDRGPIQSSMPSFHAVTRSNKNQESKA